MGFFFFKRAGWSRPFLDYMNLIKKKSSLYKVEENIQILKLRYLELFLAKNS